MFESVGRDADQRSSNFSVLSQLDSSYHVNDYSCAVRRVLNFELSPKGDFLISEFSSSYEEVADLLVFQKWNLVRRSYAGRDIIGYKACNGFCFTDAF